MCSVATRRVVSIRIRADDKSARLICHVGQIEPIQYECLRVVPLPSFLHQPGIADRARQHVAEGGPRVDAFGPLPERQDVTASRRAQSPARGADRTSVPTQETLPQPARHHPRHVSRCTHLPASSDRSGDVGPQGPSYTREAAHRRLNRGTRTRLRRVKTRQVPGDTKRTGGDGGLRRGDIRASVNRGLPASATPTGPKPIPRRPRGRA